MLRPSIYVQKSLIMYFSPLQALVNRLIFVYKQK